MRFGACLVLAGTIVSSLPVASAEPAKQRPDRQVVCEGVANGERSEEVSVMIYVEPDGTRVGSSSSWSPPVLARIGGAGLDQPDLHLTLLYVDPNDHSIGKPEGAFVTASLFSPPRKPISEAKLGARLNGLFPSISYDGGPARGLKYDPPNSLIMAIPGTAFRSATIDFPEPLPREVTISLADRSGKPVLSQRYATRGIATRDALYVQAWRQADAAAANLMSCNQTTEAAI